MNPSNFGIALAFFVLPWVNTIPYRVHRAHSPDSGTVRLGDSLALGTRLNIQFTGRFWLIGSWLLGFFAQAAIRSTFGTSLLPAELMMMTGPAYVLFTFYMITDPQTSPIARRSQIAFGLGIAAVYGLLMTLHIVFAIFFSVTIVCAIRGAYMIIAQTVKQRNVIAVPAARTAPLEPVIVPTAVMVPASVTARMDVRHE
jgi:hypothetical protein